MFRKKYDFKPDKTDPGILKKLYLTQKQRLSICRWTLYALALLVLSLVQDCMLSHVRIYGATTELVSAGILLCCVLLDPDSAGVFALISSVMYYLSGSAPGVYTIALLTVLGTLLSIFRRGYLRKGFSTTLVCAGAAMLMYQVAVFLLELFFGRTHLGRFGYFCLQGGLSIAAMPVLYPVFVSIGKIGGESWKE
ncbi:MAG: hypothetical protein LUJ09_00025 [Firmicutes bacterium]|nr:hypothetical protein [Bacillota bacterium]